MLRFHALLLLLCAWTLLPASGESWTHEGSAWKSASGTSFQVPSGFTVDVKKDGSLTIKNATGDLLLGTQFVSSKAAADEAVADTIQQLQGADGKWGPPQTSKHGKIDVTTCPGTVRMNGEPADSTLGYLTDGGIYLLIYSFYPGSRKEDFQSLLTSLSQSLVFSK